VRIGRGPRACARMPGGSGYFDAGHKLVGLLGGMCGGLTCLKFAKGACYGVISFHGVLVTSLAISHSYILWGAFPKDLRGARRTPCAGGSSSAPKPRFPTRRRHWLTPRRHHLDLTQQRHDLLSTEPLLRHRQASPKPISLISLGTKKPCQVNSGSLRGSCRAVSCPTRDCRVARFPPQRVGGR
jgi:hypothetical protein